MTRLDSVEIFIKYDKDQVNKLVADVMKKLQPEVDKLREEVGRLRARNAVLGKIAEAAFRLEQATTLHADYCPNCSGSNFGGAPDHDESCPWQRIQELRKELEG